MGKGVIMAKLDIREPSEVSEIKWCDNDRWNIVKHSTNTIGFKNEDAHVAHVAVGKTNALNLIKAIDKAIELGWVK